MIDVLTEKVVLGKEQLKARAMARLSEAGLGHAERMANMERLVYFLLDPVVYPLADRAQVDAIGAALKGVEVEYLAECASNERVRLVLEYEAAADRLALPALVAGVDVTQEMADADAAERAAAQAVVGAATADTVALAASRAAA